MEQEKRWLDIGDKFTYEDNEIRYTITVTGANTCDLIISEDYYIECACEAKIDVPEKDIVKAKMLQTSKFHTNKDKIPDFICLKNHYYVHNLKLLNVYKKCNISLGTADYDEDWLSNQPLKKNMFGGYMFDTSKITLEQLNKKY